MTALDELRAGLWLRRCDTRGEGAWVDARPYIQNRGRIEIGRGLRLHCLPTTSHLVTSPGGRIVIGDRVEIGHGAAIMANELVQIGDGARIGPFVLILDNDLHQVNSFYSGGRSQPVIIGAGAVLGPHVTLLRGAEVGEGARVLAGSVVSRPIPAGAVAAGVPAAPLGSWGAWDAAAVQ